MAKRKQEAIKTQSYEVGYLRGEPEWNPKPSHKGKPCKKGQPVLHDELKKSINLMLTPTALARLQELAVEMKTSRSEVVEWFLREVASP